MKPFNFIKAESLESALAPQKEGTQFIAGGTNLVDLMKKNIAHPNALLDVSSALPNKVVKKTLGISIGAMARNNAVANDQHILAEYPLVAKALLAGASPQIRNMASVGGNILQRTRCPYFYDITTPCNKRQPGSGCSALQGENRMSAVIGYSEQCVAVHPSDLCVALAALDATVNISQAKQKTGVIPFKNFHTLPGTTPQKDNSLPDNALITSVEIAANPFNKNCAYVKVRDRDSYAFALISVAAALQLNNKKIVQARLASGGVAHKPWRWFEAEQFLKGKDATAANFTEAASIAVKDLKPLMHNGFKTAMLKGAIETALKNCINI